jgi:hypothetical protein
MAADTDKTMRRWLGSLGLGREPEPAKAPARTPVKSPAGGPIAKPRPKNFHAVSIEPGHHACAAANFLRGKRYLSSEAPALPLRQCACQQCECRYLHHEDRRNRSRRARDVGTTVDEFVAVERRKGGPRGRRQSDR